MRYSVPDLFNVHPAVSDEITNIPAVGWESAYIVATLLEMPRPIVRQFDGIFFDCFGEFQLLDTTDVEVIFVA